MGGVWTGEVAGGTSWGRPSRRGLQSDHGGPRLRVKTSEGRERHGVRHPAESGLSFSVCGVWDDNDCFMELFIVTNE